MQNSSVLDTPAALGTVLSIWAHPDDETYLAGGLMAHAIATGSRVVCASASAGEHGTDDPDSWPPERLGTVRRLESAAAMAVLGVTEHHMLGLPDGALSEHDEAGTAWVVSLFDEVRPDTVLTFGADGITGHPDHVAVHRWVSTAWNACGRWPWLLHASVSATHLARFGPLYEEWGVYMTDDRPSGVPEELLAVDLRLDGSALDRKMTALRAMATQTAPAMAQLSEEVYASMVAEETFVDADGPFGLRRRLAIGPAARSGSAFTSP